VEVTVVATFVKVGAKTKALIRKQGYPTRSKTFVRYADAQAWAKKLESEIRIGNTNGLLRVDILAACVDWTC
jgi:hypothetical protein